MSTLMLMILLSSTLIHGTPTIGRYFTRMRDMVFAPESLRYVRTANFDQRQSESHRGFFQSLYGFRGQNLIDMYGQGLPPERLRSLGLL